MNCKFTWLAHYSKSSCPIPCTTWSTDTRLLGEYARANRNFSTVNLTFAPKVNITKKMNNFLWSFFAKVPVTTTSYLKFYLSNFFSDLGGSLGLWLGVGILQVHQGNKWQNSFMTQVSPKAVKQNIHYIYYIIQRIRYSHSICRYLSYFAKR